jgi:predicted secreted protein
MLTAIKSMQPMTLMWDETSTSDNQTRAKATFARKGQAFLNDCTFQFDDRTNSTKQLQFTGSGPLQSVGSSEATQVIPLGSYTKGQFVRLFLGSDNSADPAKVIAAARTLALHVSLSLENSTTKDTPGSWQVQEPTGLSYDITTSALVRGVDTITSSVDGQDLASIEEIYEAGTPVKWKIANVTGDNQRTASSTIVRGSCLITQLSIQAQNRQSATYQATLTGYGDYDTNS